MFFPLSVAQICDMTMCCIFCIFHAHLQFSCCCIVSRTPYRDMLYKYITECVFDCIWVYVFKWILQLKKNHQRKFNTFIQFSSTFLCRMTIRNYNPQPCKLSGFYMLHVHCRLLVWRFFLRLHYHSLYGRWKMRMEFNPIYYYSRKKRFSSELDNCGGRNHMPGWREGCSSLPSEHG